MLMCQQYQPLSHKAIQKHMTHSLCSILACLNMNTTYFICVEMVEIEHTSLFKC